MRRILINSSGRRLYSIGLDGIRFTLAGLSPPQGTASVAPPVLAHPSGRRSLLNVPDRLRCRAIRQISLRRQAAKHATQDFTKSFGLSAPRDGAGEPSDDETRRAATTPPAAR